MIADTRKTIRDIIEAASILVEKNLIIVMREFDWGTREKKDGSVKMKPKENIDIVDRIDTVKETKVKKGIEKENRLFTNVAVNVVLRNMNKMREIAGITTHDLI